MKHLLKHPVFIGLLIAQAISSIYVYQSDLEVFKTVSAIKAAGYIPIPNERVMPSLKLFLPAWYGGFFFTLSIGAALSLLSFAAIRAWDKIFKRDKRTLRILILFWMGCLVLSNISGFCALAASFWLIIPAAVSWLALKQLPSSEQSFSHKQRWIHSAVVLMIVILGISFVNINVFLNFRDNLLLSNPIGLRVNNFYYDYTLYAAEVLKPPSQKLLRTCNLSFDDTALKQRVERQLLYYDYFCVNADIDVDLEMNQAEAEKFLQEPSSYLKKISERSDRYAFFRSCVWLSVLVMPILALYGCIYGLFHILFACFRHSPYKTGIALILCGSLILFVFFYQQNKPVRPAQSLQRAILSDDPQQRFNALRWIATTEFVDIAEFDVSKILKSRNMMERYWLLRALAKTDSAKSFDILIKLIDDSQFNIAYTAYAFLGRQKNMRAVPEILKRLPVSDNWYVQNYAYKALRRLGWSQSKSK